MYRLKYLHGAIFRLAHVGGESLEFHLIETCNMYPLCHTFYFSVSASVLLGLRRYDGFAKLESRSI